MQRSVYFCTETLHPTPYTLHPTPFKLHPGSLNSLFQVVDAACAASHAVSAAISPCCSTVRDAAVSGCSTVRECFTDNLPVRIFSIIEIISVDRSCAMGV